MPEAILEKVQLIFRDIFDDSRLSIGRESSAQTVEGWDSLAHINLVSAVEQEFDVRFALGELETLKDVGEMVDLIQAKLPVPA
jgi:acyl carrier protein